MHFLHTYRTMPACVFCGIVKEGVVCNSCATYFCERNPPFCELCGVRLISEDTYCSTCRLCYRDVCEIRDLRYIHSRWSYNAYTEYISKEFKKNGNRLLGYYIALELKKYLETLHLFNEQTCIIPIPSNSKHMKEVGFDHMKLLCSYLVHMGKIHVYRCIARHPSIAQKTLNRSDREKNMRENLYLTNTLSASSCIRKKIVPTHFNIVKILLKYNDIVLLDDIATTGASLCVGASLLIPLHRKIVSRLSLVSLIRNEY